MRRALRPFSISVVAAVLLMQPPCAHAQQRTPVSEQSEKEKAKMREKRASERERPTRLTSPHSVKFRMPNKGRSLGRYSHGSSKIAITMSAIGPKRTCTSALHAQRWLHFSVSPLTFGDTFVQSFHKLAFRWLV